jgi:hypothetical protein
MADMKRHRRFAPGQTPGLYFSLALVGALSLVLSANAHAIALQPLQTSRAADGPLRADVQLLDVQAESGFARARESALAVARADVGQEPSTQEPGSAVSNAGNVPSKAVGFGQLLAPDTELALQPAASDGTARPPKEAAAARQPMRRAPTRAHARFKSVKRHGQKARPTTSRPHHTVPRKAVRSHQAARSRVHAPGHSAQRRKSRTASAPKNTGRLKQGAHAVPVQETLGSGGAARAGAQGAAAAAVVGLQAAGVVLAPAQSANQDSLSAKATAGASAADSSAQHDASDKGSSAELAASAGAVSNADQANAPVDVPAAPVSGSSTDAGEPASVTSSQESAAGPAGSAPQTANDAKRIPDPAAVDRQANQRNVGHADERTSPVRLGWPWAWALLLLALAGIFMVRRRRAARLGAGGDGTVDVLPTGPQRSASADLHAGAGTLEPAGHTDAAAARPDGEALAVASVAASDLAVSAVAALALAEPLREPAVGAAESEAATRDGGADGDAYDHGFSCTTESLAIRSPSGEAASLPHALTDKLAAAKALRADGHVAEAASQAHEILQICEALETELQALTQRIQVG